MKFDIQRAILSKQNLFEPFPVRATRDLREALENGVVRDDTSLLITKRSAGTIALLTSQMDYHHVAQGELAGEPWMVSF